MGIIIVLTVTVAVLLGKIYLLKKDVYKFANQVEKALDYIITGKEVESLNEAKDTLWGKVSEKMERVNHIWLKKRQKMSDKKNK